MASKDFTLTQDRLKELLHYCPKTGIFTWKNNHSSRANKNDIAGTIHFSPSGKKYYAITIDNNRFLAHRLAFLYMTGKWPEFEVDHGDGNGFHNWWDNLEEVTRSGNSKNTRRYSNNTSGCCGVSWHKLHKKWLSSIKQNYKNIYLGCFSNFNDAVIARKMAEYEFGFHKNHGENRPL